MKKVLKWYIASHPINTTLVQQTMQQHGHELLYTPPYESWMQPIELVWAQIKRQVAMQSHRERKYQETAQQTRDALRAVTADRCASIILHTEKLMSAWLQSSDAGSLCAWPSLSLLVKAKHEDIAAHPDMALENVGGSKESDQEEQEEQTEDTDEEADAIAVLYSPPGVRRSARRTKQVLLAG